MGTRVTGGRRRAGVATVTVAAVAVVALGTGSAQAAGGRSGSSHGHAGAGGQHHGRAVSPGARTRFEAAKEQTLRVLLEQGREHVEMLRDQDPTLGVRTPREWHYEPAESATVVQDRSMAFLNQPAHLQENAHLMVIAYRPATTPQELPQARLILPSMRGAVLEYIATDEELSEEESTYTLENLKGLGREGYRFYTQVGTHLRPLEARTRIWWPEGNNGRTRRHLDRQLAKDTVNAQILEYLYRPDAHTEKLTAQEVTGHISVFRDNKYDENNRAHVRAIAVRLHELARFGLIKNHGQSARRKGTVFQYGALTKEDIERYDAMSIDDRIDLYAPAGSTSGERKILDQMYIRNTRGQVFDGARLEAEMPELKKLSKGYAANMLWRLHEADLVGLVEKGVQRHKQSQYTTFS